jgi:membrane protein required for colicin V production
MTWFDYVVIATVLLSALLGLWRGLVYEVLSLLAWIAAWFAAKWFAASVAPYMPAALGDETVRKAAAFAALFIAALIVGGILAWLLSKLVQWVGLGWLDRLLGGLFGLMRGALIVVAGVLLAGMTNLPQQAFWRDAWSGKQLERVALHARAWLPDDMAQRVHF